MLRFDVALFGVAVEQTIFNRVFEGNFQKTCCACCAFVAVVWCCHVVRTNGSYTGVLDTTRAYVVYLNQHSGLGVKVERQTYTPREAAEILGVHPNTVYEQVHQYLETGIGIPAFRVGRAIRIPKRVIDELVAADARPKGAVDSTDSS